MTVGGTDAAGSLLAKRITVPPVGAGPVSDTAPVAEDPSASDKWLTFNDERVASVIVNSAGLDVFPRVAVLAADPCDETPTVITVNVVVFFSPRP